MKSKEKQRKVKNNIQIWTTFRGRVKIIAHELYDKYNISGLQLIQFDKSRVHKLL